MIVYDVVLLPPKAIDAASVALSKQLEMAGTKFTLNETNALPHLSLYMANFTPDHLQEALARLQDIAASTKTIDLTASGYTPDFGQGMFEVTYQNTPAITALQTAAVDRLNPLRTGLREKDPVGRQLTEYIPTTSGELRANFDTYGYDEIGGFFRPHITFTRFNRYDHSVDTTTLLPPHSFDGTFTTLGLCEMGENGTCSRIVASWELGAH